MPAQPVSAIGAGSTQSCSSPPDADEVSNTLDLERLILRLGKPDRQLIGWLRAGISVGQIAEFLGISYSAAATRIHRAKARLREISKDS